MIWAGIHSVKTDLKAQTVTVDGTIKADKLVSLLRKKVHKHAEIIASKGGEKIKEEKKVQIKEEKVKEKEEIVSESGKKIVEIKEEVKVVEVKSKEGSAPYFIHYVYAPQLFSDENPNACTIC